MTTEKTEDKTKQNRDFERHKVYAPKSLDIDIRQNQNKTDKDKSGYINDYTKENKFRFKNSLIITPFYEIEFNATGGIKYIKNHEDCVFFTNDGIFATTNNVQKIPVLLKREINKQSMQKKLIVQEKYNYEEKYEIYKNIILYYEENRIDFQIQYNKSEQTQHPKDITTEFILNLSVPGISVTDGMVTYKKYDGNEEYKSSVSAFSDFSESLEYMIIEPKPGGLCMSLYPDKNLLTEYKNKSLNFTASNISQPQKNYINLKIFLENYKIT